MTPKVPGDDARYLAEDASSRDRWLNKWASGTHHWLHYWRSAPDEVVWQDDPAWLVTLAESHPTYIWGSASWCWARHDAARQKGSCIGLDTLSYRRPYCAPDGFTCSSIWCCTWRRNSSGLAT